ncbi:sphingomyelinase C-like [Antedon mediterranea]|uniref:sphingomyelinase C-like n=1 Tax=Antedon mediterranea TaxID=105859 RepID=UPI003AF6308D
MFDVMQYRVTATELSSHNSFTMILFWTVLSIFLPHYVYADYWSCVGGEDDLLRREGRPFVWVDHSSTSSPPSRLTCSVFGLDFVCSSSSCDSAGTGCTAEALCAAPEAQPLTEATSANNLQVVAYNIYELDYLYDPDILNLPKLYVYSGQRERTCRIPLNILQNHPHADVLVMEELFMGGCFPDDLDFRDLLNYYGFTFVTPNVGVEEEEGDNPLIYENGGVAIASRWPIVYYEDHVFTNSDPTTTDAYASKGVMYAHIMKSDGNGAVPYHVFGTHMQAEVGSRRETVREAQAAEIFDFIEGFGISSSEAVIMAGDFNADLNNYPDHAYRVLSQMGGVLPSKVGPLQTTWDPLTNELIISSNEPDHQWLDYVVLSSSHLTVDVSANLVAFKPQDPNAFSVCISATTGDYVSSKSSDCNQSLEVTNLSDHYAVVGSFIFPRNPVIKKLTKKKCCKNWRFL